MVSVLIAVILLGGAYYVIVQRPQAQYRAEHEQLVHGIGVGDHVMTVGGIYGTVREIGGESAVIEIAPGHALRIATDGISRRVAQAPPPVLDDTPSAGPDTQDETHTDMQQPHHQQHTPAQPQPQPQPAAPANPGTPWPAQTPPASAPAPGGLPAFQPSFTAVATASPATVEPAASAVEPPITPAEHVTVAPPVPHTQYVPTPEPAHSPASEPEAPADESTPVRTRSETPDGFGPSATREDPGMIDTFAQADRERDELAAAWRAAVGSPVAMDEPQMLVTDAGYSPAAAPTQPEAGAPARASAQVFPAPATIPSATNDGEPATTFEAPRPFARSTPLTG